MYALVSGWGSKSCFANNSNAIWLNIVRKAGVSNGRNLISFLGQISYIDVWLFVNDRKSISVCSWIILQLMHKVIYRKFDWQEKLNLVPTALARRMYSLVRAKIFIATSENLLIEFFYCLIFISGSYQILNFLWVPGYWLLFNSVVNGYLSSIRIIITGEQSALPTLISSVS